MARGEAGNSEQVLPLAGGAYSDPMPRLLRGMAAHRCSLVLAAEALMLGSTVFLAVYLRFIAYPDPCPQLDPLGADEEALDDLTQRERNRLTQYGKQVLTPIRSLSVRRYSRP